MITAGTALPDQDSYTVVLPGGTVVTAEPERRDQELGLALLKLADTRISVRIEPAAPAEVGALALVIGTNTDGTPNARLTGVHSLAGENGSGLYLTLDALPGLLTEGSLVLDAAGGMLGICVGGSNGNGEPRVVPRAAVANFLGEPAASPARRGWIGAVLQPVSLPDDVRGAHGQTTGRLVLNVVRSGPLDRAGVRRGDILLMLDGESLAGCGALRSLLGPDRIGRDVELRFARHGRVSTRRLVVAEAPGA
jgi:serine protease DegQ